MERTTLNIPVIALRGLTVFPDLTLSFDVEREISIYALDNAMEGDRSIFLVTQREIATTAPTEQDLYTCLLYTSPSPRDRTRSRMPSSA